MADLTIRPLTPGDRDWVRQKIIERWGAEIVVAHAEVFHPVELPGFAAEVGGEVVGLLTFHVAGEACEIITIDSWREGLGIGTALVEAARKAARREGCRRLWLITTNNNTSALHFYQKRGFTIFAVRINAMVESRRLKPEIPLVDEEGLPIRDEIQMELWL